MLKFTRFILLLCFLTFAAPGLAAAQNFAVVVNHDTYANAAYKYTYSALAVKASPNVAQALGVNVETYGVDSSLPHALQPVLAQNYDLIVAIGYDVCLAALKAAPQNPNQKFALVDFTADKLPPNICAYSFNGVEAAYVAGYWAALAAPGHKVGFVGGRPFPTVVQMGKAFANGAFAAKPGVTVMSVYTDDFFNPTAGYNAAKRLYFENAGVVFAAAGQSSYGVIQAAVDCNRLAVGVDADQYAMAPNFVLTSVVLDIERAVREACQSVLNGNFAGGRQFVMNLANKGVSLGQSNDKNESVLKRVNALQNDIISGKIKVMP